MEISGGGEGSNQKTFCGGGIDIFWNHTILLTGDVNMISSKRTLFIPLVNFTDRSYEIVASVHLSSISDVKKFSRKNLPKDKQMFLMDGFEIFCSNIQSHRVRLLFLLFWMDARVCGVSVLH